MLNHKRIEKNKQPNKAIKKTTINKKFEIV